MKGTFVLLLALECILGDVDHIPRQLDMRGDPIDVATLSARQMDPRSEESEEEMRVDPIDVATLSMGRKGMARNGRQFAPLACGANDTLNYGEYAVIETPKFGRRKYKNRYNCEWNLVIPANSNLWFSCEYFDVKKGDYLYLAEMPLYGYSDTGFYMEPVTSPDYDVSVTLRFETNKRRRGWGFRCYVDSEEQSFSPNATTTTTTATTAAPGVETTTTTAAPANCNCGIPNRSNRIVGGVETEENEYPWQVGLVSASGSRPWCGGTLISDRHVLTAAHCTAGSSPSSISVLVGEHRTDDSTFTRVPLSAITDHPDYNSGTLDNDYSILTLAEPVEFSAAIAPACLPSTNSDFAGVLATVSGWGTLSSGGNQPTVLNEVDVTVQSNAECNSAYGSGITDNMICAADAGKDSCQGDSGGPLVAQENDKYTLIGVVSWGYGCAMPQYPGVYARVTEKMDWILANTSGTQLSSCGTAAGR